MRGFSYVTISIVAFNFVFNCDALNCRTDGGPNEQSLKAMYMTCLKRQDGRDNETRITEEGSRGNKRKLTGGRWRDNSRDDWSKEGNRDSMSREDGRDYSSTSRYGTGRDEWSMRDKSPYESRMSGGNPMMMGNDGMARDDFMADEFGQDMPKYSHRQSTPAPRRYRRDRTTGHRSQYNPNSPRRATMDDSRRRQTVDEKSSAENNMTSKESDKACALHCFMQELDMTGENGMPDKHMVLQVITKGVTNDELRDFLQETIEECFAILQNENTKDKCEFSKNLMMCLSEKGRANCDDWKDDMKF